MSDSGHRARTPWLAPALGALAAAALFAAGLGSHPIGRDEAVAVLEVRRGLGPMLLLVAAHEPHPAGYFAMLWAWPHATPLQSRLLSYLPAVATVPLLVLCGRRLRLPAGSAAALGATSPFLAYYAAETRMYSWLAAWGAAALLLTLDVAGRSWPSKRRLALLGAALGAGLYLHYFATFTIVGLLYLIWRRHGLRPAAQVAASAGTVFLPGLLLLLAQAPLFVTYPTEAWQRRVTPGVLEDDLSLLLGGAEGYGPARFLMALMLFAAALAGHRSAAARVRTLGPVILAGLGLPLLLGVAFTLVAPRYLAAGVPALLLLVVSGLATLPRVAAAAAAAVLALAGAALILDAMNRPDLQKPPVPAMLAQAREAGATVAVQHRHFAPQAAYYEPGGEVWTYPAPRVDHVGLWALPPGATIAPGRPVLVIDYCDDPPALPAGYGVPAVTRWTGTAPAGVGPERRPVCTFLARPS